jgi:acyl carrier protein
MSAVEDELNSVERICGLVSGCIAWADGEEHTEIEPDTELLALGLLDSLTIVRIVKMLEEQLGVVLPTSMVSAKNFRTPEHLARAVTQVRAGQS